MKKILLVTIICAFLSACATTPNIPLNQKFWQQHQGAKVSSDRIRHAGLYQQGSEGLLDIAINDVVTAKFSKYLNSYRLQEIYSMRSDFVKRLRQHHVKANIYPVIDMSKLSWVKRNTRQYSERNFSQYATKIGKNKLLIVSVNMVGAVRSYYGFIPLGAPKAICTLEGRLVNAKTNQILWRYTSKIVMPVNGGWDQPPNYPNFTKALGRAIHLSRTQLMDNFFAGRSE